jgi:hypothetical protein
LTLSITLDDEPAAAIPGSSTHSAHTNHNTRPRVRMNDRIVMAGSIATARAATIYTELIPRSPSARLTHLEGRNLVAPVDRTEVRGVALDP